MLNNISWTDYCYTLLILYSFYYVIIGIYYYKHDLRQLLSGKTMPLQIHGKQPANAESPSLYIQSIIDEVCALCDHYRQSSYTKSEILAALKLLLAKHITARAAGHAEMLSGVIRDELEKRCSIRVSPAELDLLWEG